MRPARRAILALVLLLLGGMSATRMPVSYLPSRSSPELQVRLVLTTDTEPEDVTRQWVVPIESAIRALGGVVAMRGEVDARGVSLRVRLTPKSDAVRKCARLLASLGEVRTSLPTGSTLAVWPTGAGGLDAVALLAAVGPSRTDSCDTVTAALRAVTGVRDVRTYGCPEPMTRVTVAGGATVPMARLDQIEQSMRRSTQARRVGVWRDAVVSTPVVVAERGLLELDTLAIATGRAVVPLGRLARITHNSRAAQSIAAIDGEPAVLFEVSKDQDASLVAVDRVLREAATRLERSGEVELRVIWSDAEPVARLLSTLQCSLVFAVGSMLIAGWLLAGVEAALQLAVAPILALAAALQLLWFGGVQLDVVSLTGLSLAIAVALPMTLLRVVVVPSIGVGTTLWAIVTAALVPIAVTLATGELAASLVVPARAFFLATIGATASALIVASPRESRRPRVDLRFAPALGRWLRPAVREPAVVLLAATSLSYVLLTLCGASLDPRNGRISPDPGRLIIRLSMPEGTSIGEVEQQLRVAERSLKDLDAVEQSYSWARAGEATLTARLRPELRTPGARRQVVTGLQYRLNTQAAVVRIDSAAAVGGFSFSDPLEDRVEADDDGGTYRVLLRSTELAPLVHSFAQVRDLIVGLGIRAAVFPRWGVPSVRIQVQPVPGIGLRRTRELATQLRRSSAGAMPAPRNEHLGRSVVVSTSEQPDKPIPPPQRRDLLAAVNRAGASLRGTPRLNTMEHTVYSGLARQAGRFTLPLDVHVPGRRSEDRRDFRLRIHRALDGLSFASGTDLERPALESSALERLVADSDRVRLYALTALLPVLLWLTASSLLDSLRGGTAALVPAIVAVAVVTPVLWRSGTSVDEMGLLAIAAAVCGTLPIALHLLHGVAARQRFGSAFAVYRTVRELAPAVIFGAAILATVLAAAGVDDEALPLRLAAVVGPTSLLASLFVVGPLTLVWLEWRRFDLHERARRRDPPTWLRPVGPPLLELRGLGKRYGRDRWAVRDISLTLAPGVVGLLGPNGAGKTTLIRCLTGLLRATRGTVRFRRITLEGANLAAFRRHLGFLPQEFNAYPGFTGEDFLNYWAHELGLAGGTALDAEIARLLDTVGLAADARRKVRDYSGGMRQRIGIARALLGSPALLIVDEPTTGLDVAARNRFREVLLRIATDRIVILSTHIASDVEATAGRLLVLVEGRLRFDGTPAALVAQARGRVFECMVSDADLRTLSRVHRVTRRVREFEGVRVRAVALAGVPAAAVAVEPTLEEAYLAAMDERKGGRRDSLSFLGGSKEG